MEVLLNVGKVLITGGSGFIGTNLVADLLLKKVELINLDIKPPKIAGHVPYWKPCDIRENQQIINLMDEFQPSVVIHLAAKTDLNGKVLADYNANIEGVENVVHGASKCRNLRLILFASTRLVNKIGYTPKSDMDYCPTTLYGESKVEGEKIVRANASLIPCQWLILRPTSIWGPWFGTPYNDFFMSVIHSYYIHPKNRSIKKSFGYIGNAIFQINRLVEDFPSEFDKKTMYLSDYEPIDVYDWSKKIALAYGVRPPLQVGFGLLRLIAKCGDILKKIGYKEPPLTSFRLNNILTDMIYDTQLMEKHCGELPFTQSEGIRETLKWIAQQK